jgi:hypothetical protein
MIYELAQIVKSVEEKVAAAIDIYYYVSCFVFFFSASSARHLSFRGGKW